MPHLPPRLGEHISPLAPGRGSLSLAPTAPTGRDVGQRGRSHFQNPCLYPLDVHFKTWLHGARQRRSTMTTASEYLPCETKVLNTTDGEPGAILNGFAMDA